MNEARGRNEWQEAYGGGFGMQSGEARLSNVPVELLDPWQDKEGKGQPFRMYSDVQLNELAENIRRHGIITPLRVRPVGRRFQILAGHNRCAAAKLIGLRTVPALVEAADDARAAEILVDSNLQQRQELLPSEKAFAYKLKLDSMKRQAGRPCNEYSCQIGTDFFGARSDEILAQKSSDSARQIQRYIRLTYLIPELLQMVDEGSLKLIAGVELSFLPQNTQSILLRLMLEECVKINTAKAKRLHKAMPATEDDVRVLLLPKPKTPAITLKLELPELSEAQYEKLAANADFQNELLRTAAALAKRYLNELRL